MTKNSKQHRMTPARSSKREGKHQKLQPVDEIRLRKHASQLVLGPEIGSVKPPELRVSAEQKYNLNCSDYV